MKRDYCPVCHNRKSRRIGRWADTADVLVDCWYCAREAEQQELLKKRDAEQQKLLREHLAARREEVN